MACLRIAEAIGFDLSPLNVRAVAIEKLAGIRGFLPFAVSRKNSSSISVPKLNFDFAITGGPPWRRIS